VWVAGAFRAHSSRLAAIPVTVLTGYLGSGKTTLLRRLLSQNAGTPLRLAVIENEVCPPPPVFFCVNTQNKLILCLQFATSNIGTENELKEDAQHAACTAQIIETSSGCLCCSGSKDFKRVLRQLIEHRDKFDAVIIETTGLADPSFAATFFNDPR
jgi:G3E family GTPase